LEENQMKAYKREQEEIAHMKVTFVESFDLPSVQNRRKSSPKECIF